MTGIFASPVYFSGTGHYYDYSSDVFDWWGASIAAQSRTLTVGDTTYSGYLATLNTQAENDFLWNNVSTAMGWIGASDAANEGIWQWITGPEGLQTFWQYGATITYANWSSGEPNNAVNNENYGVFGWSGSRWNDLEGGNWGQYHQGYYIEYSVVPEPQCFTLLLLGALVARLARRYYGAPL